MENSDMQNYFGQCALQIAAVPCKKLFKLISRVILEYSSFAPNCLDQSTIPLSSYGLRLLFVNVVAHPMDYARFLIQIGYEPLPAYPATSIFGRSIMRLPGVFKYLNYIRKRDGCFGLYRGVFPKVVSQIVGSAATQTALEYLKLEDCRKLMSDRSLPENESYFRGFPTSTGVNDSRLLFDEWQTLTHSLGFEDVVGKIRTLRLCYLVHTLKKVVVERVVFATFSQPFVVISARMMASFVGGEEGYRGFFSSIWSIISEDGLLGFFSGYVPRLLGELSAAVVSTLVIYGVNNYLIAEKELQNLASTVIVYYINIQIHPMAVVSSCMTVNNTSLKAGQPPHMQNFNNWITCWRHLMSNNQLYRGSTLFIRRFHGPPRGHLALN